MRFCNKECYPTGGVSRVLALRREGSRIRDVPSTTLRYKGDREWDDLARSGGSIVTG